MASLDRKWASAAVWLLTAVAALAVGVAMVFQTRGALEREREFRAAPPCASVPVEVSECRWEQRFTVRSADTHSGSRSQSPEAVLTPPSGEPWHVTFRQSGPVLSRSEAGDEVVGVVWRGRLVDLRDASGRWQETSDGPLEWPEDRLGGALAGLSFGVMGLVGTLWSLLAPDPRHASAARAVRWHGAAMAVAALVALWVQAANDWPMWSIPAVWGPSALLLLASAGAFTVAGLRGELDADAPSVAVSLRKP
ncbi:hypothetical protein PV392_02055 [Streptomyces sp. ME03-5709C]|nr:hypothetical protein [Streptomyces sp. ME03-5709C]